MASVFDDNAQGGISFTSPTFTFGSSNPSINGGYSFDLPLAAIQAFQNNAFEFARQNTAGSQAFLSGVMGNSQAAVNATSKQVTGFQNNALNVLRSFGNDLSKGLRKSSGCFITTAICKDSGKPDDCEELTILRKFRDDVMMHKPLYRKMLREYYDIAPSIVAAIDRTKNPSEIYKDLRENYLEPAIEQIKSGNNAGAIETYKQMVLKAKIIVGNTIPKRNHHG